MNVKHNREQGLAFEDEWAEQLGLEKTPASGNQWHSPLDTHGFSALWSLKSTSLKTFPVSQVLIDEAVDACEGPGGDGSTPLWGIRIGTEQYDMVMMRKSDFLRILSEERKLARESKAEAKRRSAEVPILFRDEA